MSFVTPALPYLMAAGTALGAYSSYEAGRYQSQVAANNADLMARQAKLEAHAANEDMQDRDQRARAEIAELMSQATASGLTATTGTMLMRRVGAESLARRDRERLANKRDINLENTKRQEQSYRAEAAAAKRSARRALLGGLFDIPTSFLSGATMVSNYQRGRLALEQPSFVR